MALDEMEKYAQARMGGNVPAQTTGQWAVAKFEHDSSRPVDGYAAPQLHTHAVIFNMTETADGQTRALQPQELYKTQQYATAVYRSELAARLQKLGYEIERGAHGQPEIKGYTREYLEASSPRRQQIEEHMERQACAGLAPRRSRRIRRAMPSSRSRMKKCGRSIKDSPPSTAISRSTLSRGGAAARCGVEAGAVGSCRARGRELCARARHGARGRSR